MATTTDTQDFHQSFPRNLHLVLSLQLVSYHFMWQCFCLYWERH